MIAPARDTAELDREIARLYHMGHGALDIAPRVGLGSGSVGRRLTKMFKSGEIPRRPR